MCVYTHIVHSIETVVGQNKKKNLGLHWIFRAIGSPTLAYLQPAQNAVATDTYHHRHLSMRITSTTGGEGGEVRSGRFRSARRLSVTLVFQNSVKFFCFTTLHATLSLWKSGWLLWGDRRRQWSSVAVWRFAFCVDLLTKMMRDPRTEHCVVGRDLNLASHECESDPYLNWLHWLLCVCCV